MEDPLAAFLRLRNVFFLWNDIDPWSSGVHQIGYYFLLVSCVTSMNAGGSEGLRSPGTKNDRKLMSFREK